MRNLIFIALLLTNVLGVLVGSEYDDQGRKIEHHIDSLFVRTVSNDLYKVTYDVEMLGDDLITSLDHVAGINKVMCDLNNIEMLVDFNSATEAYDFYKRIQLKGNTKFLTSLKYNCSDTQDRSFMNLKQILNVELTTVQVLITTTQARYEQLFQNAYVNFEPVDEPDGGEKFLCFGVNANSDCSRANAPIDIYHNKFIDITCSNCFIGAKTTVFFDFKISWFKLRHAGAGLKGMAVNGAFVLDMNAHASASGGIDKTYNLIGAGLIAQFYIGFIPITVWFEIPLRVVANSMIDAKAHAQIGVTATWSLGDAYVIWDEHKGWEKAKPSPKFEWHHVLEGDAEFNAEASLSIIPSFVVHISQVVEMGASVVPSLIVRANGSLKEKQLCAELLYRVAIEAYGAISMNLPLIKMFQKKFGPYTLYDSKENRIGRWCVKKNLELKA